MVLSSFHVAVLASFVEKEVPGTCRAALPCSLVTVNSIANPMTTVLYPIACAVEAPGSRLVPVG